MSSDPKRQSTQDGSWPTDINRGVCVGDTRTASGAKIINLVCHDAAEGFELWQESSNLEVYGNIDLQQRLERGDGPGPRARDLRAERERLEVHHRQHHPAELRHQRPDLRVSAAPLNNFVVDGNIIYQAAKVMTGGTALELVFGGSQVATNAFFRNNAVYSKRGRGVNFGYGAGLRPATVTGNTIASSGYAVAATFDDTLDVLTMTGNRIWGEVLNVNDSSQEIEYEDWPGNTFIRYTTRPTGTDVFVRPNKYEAGRGHVAVFNWGLAPSVNVDVSGILAVGAPYEVRNAQDYFGPPVVSGVYAGGTITLPMSGLSVATPIGGAVMPPPTGPEFNSFVVLTRSTANEQRKIADRPPNSAPPVQKVPRP